MRWDYPALAINAVFPGLGEIIITIIIVIIITIIIITTTIIINHLFHFSTSILHDSSSKTKIHVSSMFINKPIVKIFNLFKGQ